MKSKIIYRAPVSRQGFTLMELLVVLALSVILMALLLVPIYKTLENNRLTAASVNAQKSARDAMD
ncbi:MAG: prepilin-type N-terminal cleavage/methylation domain-containing protein [Abditibacteriota bacterium]|nr:prepilin-type N-terminal cleavage/methylation domain-containing protein [Abditibacteriota bacterium]